MSKMNKKTEDKYLELLSKWIKNKDTSIIEKNLLEIIDIYKEIPYNMAYKIYRYSPYLIIEYINNICDSKLLLECMKNDSRAALLIYASKYICKDNTYMLYIIIKNLSVFWELNTYHFIELMKDKTKKQICLIYFTLNKLNKNRVLETLDYYAKYSYIIPLSQCQYYEYFLLLSNRYNYKKTVMIV